MTFNSMHRTAFAIGLTVFIFATIVGTLCFIHRRERRHVHQAEAPAPILPAAPTPYGINLSRLSVNCDFRESDDTLVAPAVSAVTGTREGKRLTMV